MEMQDKRDHLFISYATEDAVLCDWLVRRLATEGYAVWYDRLKLLGGENWPKDIDAAIEKRTFRMLALVSRASMRKPNPTGEWLKGRAIGSTLGIEDFVIPLNIEGLQSQEIIWNLQPINYISFSSSWAKGLAALTKKLESVKTPRVLSSGSRLALESISASSAICDEPEQLMSNCFEIEQVPTNIYTFVSSNPIAPNRHRVWKKIWAYRDVSPYRIMAFHHPPTSITSDQSLRRESQYAWRTVSKIHGIKSRDLMVSLVHRSLNVLMEAAGLDYSEASTRWYLPSGRLQRDRVSVTYPNGVKRWFAGVGKRKYPTLDGGEMYRYHLSPSIRVLGNQYDQYMVVVDNHVHLTDLKGIALEGRKVPSRRKHLCRNWFNREWSTRTLGALQLLADKDMHIRLGPQGEQQLVIKAMPISPYAPKSVQDTIVEEPDATYTTWHDHEASFIDSEFDEQGQ